LCSSRSPSTLFSLLFAPVHPFLFCQVGVDVCEGCICSPEPLAFFVSSPTLPATTKSWFLQLQRNVLSPSLRSSTSLLFLFTIFWCLRDSMEQLLDQCPLSPLSRRFLPSLTFRRMRRVIEDCREPPERFLPSSTGSRVFRFLLSS